MNNISALLATTVFQNTIEAYVMASVTFLGLVFVFIFLKKLLVSQWGKIAAKTINEFDDFIVSLISQVGLPVFFVTAFYIASLPLVLAEPVRSFIRYALIIVVTIRSILILQEIVKYGVAKVYQQRMRSNDPATSALVSSITGVLRWILWSLGLVFILDNLGINISALAAGIGIGGIAVAMASQAVLGDAFSALSIFLDRPFEFGDFIIIDEHMGTVEHIGIKTTRIRSLSGEQLVFSNSDLTKSRIRNYKRMNTRRIAFKIGVVYDTPVEKVKKIPQLVKDILNTIKDVRLDRVHFQSFGDFSLNYEIVYYVLSADYNVYMDKQQEINFQIMERFEKEGIEFAYPTQTIHLKKSEVGREYAQIAR